MAKKTSTRTVVPDPSAMSAGTSDELLARAWLYYGRQDYGKSEADLRKALDLDPGNLEILYALGLTLSASGRSQEALPVFEQAVEALTDQSTVRANMLRKLIKGHISRIKTGDWHIR